MYQERLIQSKLSKRHRKSHQRGSKASLTRKQIVIDLVDLLTYSCLRPAAVGRIKRQGNSFGEISKIRDCIFHRQMLEVLRC